MTQEKNFQVVDQDNTSYLLIRLSLKYPCPGKLIDHTTRLSDYPGGP